VATAIQIIKTSVWLFVNRTDMPILATHEQPQMRSTLTLSVCHF